MHNLIRIFFILGLACLLKACHYATIEPSYDMSETEASTWASDFLGLKTPYEQQMAAQAIVAYLREQHHSFPSDFPHLKVRSLKIGNTAANRLGLNAEEKQETEKALTTIFEKVEHDLFANRPRSDYQQWPTDLIISAYSPSWTTSDTVTAAAAIVPAIALCWGSALIICPGKTTDIFSVEIIAYPPDAGVIKAIGTGASELYMQTQVYEDYSLHKEQNTKALVAATADAANKWIAVWETTAH